MIYQVEKKDLHKLNPIFSSMKDTMIASCLQGHMGTAWVDDISQPRVAQINVGVFMFLAGDPTTPAAKEVLVNLPEHSYIIVNTQEWKTLIEDLHVGSYQKFSRYAFKRDPNLFDKQKLEGNLKRLAPDYILRPIDKEIAHMDSFHALSEDFTYQYDSIAHYLEKSLGFAILYKDQVVSVASAYSVYDGGLEIEVDTHPEFRRKGLALIVSSALILESLRRNIYPNWDAVDLNSVQLAEKLGYEVDTAYDTYYIHYTG